MRRTCRWRGGVHIDDRARDPDGLTSRGSIDMAVTILSSRVDIDGAGIQASAIWYADGIRIQSPSGVEIVDPTLHRPMGAEEPEQEPHDPPYAGVEIAFAEPEGRTVEIRGSDIRGFDVSICINVKCNDVLVANTEPTGNVSAGIQTPWVSYASTLPDVDLGGGPLGSPGGNARVDARIRARVSAPAGPRGPLLVPGPRP